MSAYVPPQRPPPPGQDFYNGYSESRSRGQPRRDRRMDREYSPRGTEYRPYDYAQSDRGYSRAPPAGSEHSGYAPTQRPRGDSLYAIAPYDEEKAYAEWNRAYGSDAQTQPARSEYGSRAPPDARSRVRYSDERSSDLMTYDARGRPYDDVSLASETTYMPPRRRYDSRPPPSLPPKSPSPKNDDKDKGISALIGGASGAFLGNRLIGKGALGTLGGAVAGAIGVNVIEHFDGKRGEKKATKDGRRRRRDEYHDDSRYYSDEDYYGRPRVDSVYGSVPPPRRRYDDRPYSRRRSSRYRRRSPTVDSYMSDY